MPHTRPAKLSRRAPRAADELIAFVKRQIRNEQMRSKLEKRERNSDRMLLLEEVLVQPLDDDLQPTGESVVMVTRDISTSGIGLVNWEPVYDDHIAIQMNLSGETVRLMAKIEWCRGMGPCYYLGARFLTKLEKFPG